jgi:solute carrier family 25 phosphate transporter 23/24/25/41
MTTVLDYWKHSAFIDIGDGVMAPLDKKQEDNSWKFLIIGGIAGVTSRSATAPIDRLKTIYQIQV